MPRRFSSIRLLVWSAIPIAAGAALLWGLAPKKFRPPAGTESAQGSSTEDAPATERDPSGDRVREILEIGRSPGPNAARLIAVYGAWAAEPAALVPRKMALDALLGQQDYVARVTSIMKAVEGPRIPPEEDPLWPEVVEAIASVWTSQTIASGLNMMLAEEHSRARQLLIASIARMATSDRGATLNQDQRYAIASDLMDVKLTAANSQRDEIEEVIHKLSATGS